MDETVIDDYIVMYLEDFYGLVSAYKRGLKRGWTRQYSFWSALSYEDAIELSLMHYSDGERFDRLQDASPEKLEEAVNFLLERR